jgi:hypothetical protein
MTDENQNLNNYVRGIHCNLNITNTPLKIQSLNDFLDIPVTKMRCLDLDWMLTVSSAHLNTRQNAEGFIIFYCIYKTKQLDIELYPKIVKNFLLE